VASPLKEIRGRSQNKKEAIERDIGEEVEIIVYEW